MTNTNIAKNTVPNTTALYTLRSKFRRALYSSYYKNQVTLFGKQQHPITQGPEQISRYFAFIANAERRA